MGLLVVQYAERHPTSGTKIRVTWSEPANATDAATPGNYAMSGGVTVSAATVVAGSGNLKVDLDVSTLTKSTAYTLTVTNVKDIASSTPISSPRDQVVFLWLGVADENLNGIPIQGGLLARTPRHVSGNKALGYNVLAPDRAIGGTNFNPGFN
jgi:hypothetical protein